MTTIERTRKRKADEEKIVNDAIFGFITLKPYIVSIIDTIEFQRLRQIWQLGVAPFVYPTACHSRYEHSIGTYHLASKLINKLRLQLEEEDSELRITKMDVMYVEIAALCHDIGHGPFSHVWDNTVLPKIVESPTKHEEHFLKFWEKIKNIDEIKNLDKTLIFKLINGKETVGKEILSNIVSNSESGMDVDKWDYLARDSMYLGHASSNYRIEIDRMIHFARAIKDQNGKWKIAFRKSESLNMLRVFQLRHLMHKTACRHKTVVAIEQMMVDGFKKFFKKPENSHLPSQIGTSKWILQSNDSIFWQNIEGIEEFKRIIERDLYRTVCEIVKYRKLKEGENPKKDITEYLKKMKNELPKFKIVISEFKLGNKDPNPLLEIPFYSKIDPDKITKYTKANIPSYLQYNVDESRIIVLGTYKKIEENEKTMKQYKKLKDKIVDYYKQRNEEDNAIDINEKEWIFEDLMT